MDSFKESASLQNLIGAKRAEECLYNTRWKYVKIKGEEVLAEVLTFDASVFNPEGMELRTRDTKGKRPKVTKDSFEAEEDEAASRSESVARNRARKKVFDYILGDEDLDVFCTLTLDPSKISRTEWAEIVPKLNTWLDNWVRRHGLKYVLVPEHHKDGAIHFHGCMNSAALKLAPSGLFDKGQEIQNITSWRYGFTTAKRMGAGKADRVKVAKYVAKYMTKQNERVGGRYYLHGGELSEPFYRYGWTDFETAEGFQMSFGGRAAKVASKL